MLDKTFWRKTLFCNVDRSNHLKCFGMQDISANVDGCFLGIGVSEHSGGRHRGEESSDPLQSTGEA